MSNFVQCPFDPLHQIAPNRFGKHLTKCQRQHPDVQFARCPLNTFHYIKPEDMKEHVRTCSSRMELEAYKYTVSPAFSTPPEELIVSTGDPTCGVGDTSLQKDEESWDDCKFEAYNPLRKCKQQKEENRGFIIPCANKFVVPNVSAAMIKEEFQNDALEKGQAIKREVLSEGDRSPDRCAIVVKEEISSIEPSNVKTEHSERTDREPYRGRNYEANAHRSDSHRQRQYEGHERDRGVYRGNSGKERYPSTISNSHSDRYSEREGRESDEHSNRRSLKEHRYRLNPYHSSYSKNMRQPSEQIDGGSSRN